MSRPPAHPWCFTAPWYRWPAEGVPAVRTGRQTGPVLQKYDASSFVDEYLAQPQRSLRFDAQDYWSYLLPQPALPLFNGTRSRRLSDKRLVTTSTRKLFLTTHSRFYLVSCALHCDVPGLPAVAPSKVRRVGFVVRRRVLERTGTGRPVPPQKIMRQLGAARLALKQAPPDAGFDDLLLGDWDTEVDQSTLAGPAWSARYGTRLAAAASLATAQRQLATWASGAGFRYQLQGWVPDPERRGVGSWTRLEDPTPTVITETVHPMHAVVPSPDDDQHDGTRAGLWFGEVPTGSPDLTERGEPRFDDESVYEIRCFAERADPCQEEPVWSRPSDRYLLASPMDLIGTSHRPVTVKLPDIPQLRAQMATMKPGEGMGVRFASPPGSLQFKADNLEVTEKNTSTVTSVCSFAVPLITIVAMFVFNLFLGVVMLVFGLWWMLSLRFCIPPSFRIGVELDAELDALPSTVPLDASIDTNVDVSAETLAAIDTHLHTDFENAFGKAAADALQAEFSPGLLLELHTRLRAEPPAPGQDPSTDQGSRYEVPVARSDVVVS